MPEQHAILFYNAILYAEGGRFERGWLLVERDRIARLGRGAPPALRHIEAIDLGGQILAPGLIDLHVHGALGYDTMDATPEALCAMARFYAQHGVTSFLATSMAAPRDSILAALTNVAEVMRVGTGGAALLGAHVEGPYLDVERRGAQHPSAVRRATPAEYIPLLDTGVVRLITLAPEFLENEELVRDARARGVAIAAGHTRASLEQMRRAVALGVTQVTHLFNGMEPLHHRQPGVVGAALALDGLLCQLIADNIHIHPAVLRVAVRAKGVQGIILITDAMRGAGMADGEYDLGGQRVSVRAGVARIADGALAGSTLTLERAVANILSAADLSLEQALCMATSVPARALGLPARKGSLAVGKDADLIVLDGGLQAALTMVSGAIVHRSS